MNITIHFDGSCWPNPGGLARYGFTVKSFDGSVNHQGYGVIGENELMSNNHAELFAMSAALEYVLSLEARRPVEYVKVLGDSEVAIRLMTGRYLANREKLYYPQYVRAKIVLEELIRIGALVDFEWCPREENQECDDLSKMPVLTASTELLAEADEILG